MARVALLLVTLILASCQGTAQPTPKTPPKEPPPEEVTAPPPAYGNKVVRGSGPKTLDPRPSREAGRGPTSTRGTL